jgi:iron complex transport system ATP-binding protein
VRLELDRVSVRYGALPALCELTISVGSGTWLGVIGANGSGKTTMLRAIAGLVGHEGEVRLDGAAASGLRRREVARLVAFVPQRPLLPEATTVVEYVLLGRTPHIPYLGTETRRDRAVVGEVLERLDLSGLAGRLLGSLSGGELQRAILARALAQEPALLLLDEPTSALDVGRQLEALELVDALRRERGITVVAAMHDLTLAAGFAGSLLLLDRGRRVAFGPADHVLTEGIIRAHYGAPVRVLRTEDGVLVVPIRERHDADEEEGVTA